MPISELLCVCVCRDRQRVEFKFKEPGPNNISAVEMWLLTRLKSLTFEIKLCNVMFRSSPWKEIFKARVTSNYLC